MTRVHNFYPGPGALPLEALETAQKEFLDFEGAGMSLLEMSHRSSEYGQVHTEAFSLVRELLNVPDNYKIMFLQGGASLQFAMIPMNFLAGGKSADYVVTGIWSEKAIKEAKIVGKAHVAGSSEEDGYYRYIPKKLDLDPNAQYVHVTSNNTIMGTQYFDYPDTGDIPLVADMSSDIMWRPTDVSQFGIIYAGAHKNLGPSGVTVVILREDLLEKTNPDLPTLLKYQSHIMCESMYNTPPTYTIYMIRYVLKWLKKIGGLAEMEKRNRAKAECFYDFLDGCGGFYTCPVAVEDRSIMNPVFDLPNKELEARFVAEGKEKGYVGFRNFHPDGGGRISMYNATSLDSVKAGVEFMKDFMVKNG